MREKAKHFCKNILKENFNIAEELSSLSSFQISELIAELKLSNFCIDFLNGQKFDPFLNKFCTINNEMSSYLEQVRIINKIFKELSELRNKLNLIPSSLRLKALLVAYNELISGLEKIYKDKKDVEIAENIDALYDHLNQGIKFCCYDSEIYKNKIFEFTNKPISKQYKNIALQFMKDCCSYQKFLEETYEVWRVGAGKYIKSDNIIRFKFKPNKIYNTHLRNAAKVQFLRELDTWYSRFYDYFTKMDHNIEYDVTRTVLRQTFYTNDLSTISINNFSINQYINFYAALCLICKKRLYKHLELIVKSKDEWIDLLCKYDLDKNFCTYIFDISIFDKKSNNLFCYPFIPLDSNQFGIVTLIHKNSMPAYVLQERLLYEFSDASIKGKNFETYLLDFLKKKNIHAFKLHNKVNGEEYEVDFAFMIENTLYICECKDRVINFKNFDPKIKNEYLRQIQRNIDFYKNNINLVYEKINKGVDFKINKVYGVIINAQPFCNNEINGNIFIIDKETFITPFKELNKYFSNHPQDIAKIANEELRNEKIKRIFSSPRDMLDFLDYYDIFNFKLLIGQYELNFEGVGFKSRELSEDVKMAFYRNRYLT